MNFIPYACQDIDDDDIQAVVDVLRSDWLTQGPVIREFENAVAERCGAPHALAVSSGTAALHIACRALGVGPGDLVWTSPNTYVASANCAIYCGADVDFVDIDPTTLNLSPEALERKLEDAAADNRLPKALVLVHFSGQPCDMEAIVCQAQRHGIRIIEDASHALGATYRDEPIGKSTWSDITVFSFHPVKIATTGEGGMALTRDPSLHAKLELLRSHGTTRDPEQMQDTCQGPWYYEQILLGFNYRMTDMQAALGLRQIQRLEQFTAKRRALAARYDDLLRDVPVVRPHLIPEVDSAWHLYVVQVPADERRRIFEELRASGIGVNVHYIPVHLQPFYRERGFKPGDFPAAEEYYAGAITLPLFYGLRESEQDDIVAQLRKALGCG